MFDKSAELYDAIYDSLGKDWRAEADTVMSLVRDRRGTNVTTLLDVACGTGRHLEHFAAVTDCTGLDIQPQLLAVARRRCPGVRFVEADMADFELSERFDAVTCLFSSIGYSKTADLMGRAVSTMAGHLAPGGVLVVEPWIGPDEWIEGTVQVAVASIPGGQVVRMMRSTREGLVSALHAEYLVGRPDAIDHFTECHELGLFDTSEYVDAFEAAGLDTSTVGDGLSGRGLLIGVRR